MRPGRGWTPERRRACWLARGWCSATARPDILAYPQNRTAYGLLCQLLSLGKSRAPKGDCFLDLADLLTHRDGLLLIVMPPGEFESLKPLLKSLGPDTWLAASMLHTGEDRRRLKALIAHRQRQVKLPLIAVNDVLYHDADQRAIAGHRHLHSRTCDPGPGGHKA